ncbi:MAG: ATP-dependent Clp protease ATP-binding subunit ClpX [Chitinophagaceae bacterium]
MLEHCSFCLREKQEVGFLLLSDDGKCALCPDCIEQHHKLLQMHSVEQQKKSSTLNIKNRKPREIKKFLDLYIIAQEEAKKTLSVAVYNHYKRILQEHDTNDVEIEKSNIVLVGQTGTGKTLLAKTIARFLQVPFAIVDATVFTQAGYVGEDVESILSRLLQECDYDIPLAEKGIVFIDEIDKIARKGDNPSITRDVSGEGVQQSLLKLLEGSEVLVPPQGGRKHPEQQFLKINTQNILFICGGSFDGIQKIISKRLNAETIGFKHHKDKYLKKTDILHDVNAHDLRSFGLIPELIGRLPIISFLRRLDKDTLMRVLLEPKNALIKQYKKLFELEGKLLKIDNNVYDYIIDKGLEYDLGARGLRSICEKIFEDILFDLPDYAEPVYHLTLNIAKDKFER